MTKVEIRNIRAEVDARDLWLAEEANPGRVRSAISAAVSAAIHEVATPPRPFETRVLDLWKAGLCDALIAGETGVLKMRVGQVRRSLGLPANRCHRNGGRRSGQ